MPQVTWQTYMTRCESARVRGFARARRGPEKAWKRRWLDPEGDIESLVHFLTDVEESKIQLIVQGEPQG